MLRASFLLRSSQEAQMEVRALTYTLRQPLSTTSPCQMPSLSLRPSGHEEPFSLDRPRKIKEYATVADDVRLRWIEKLRHKVIIILL